MTVRPGSEPLKAVNSMDDCFTLVSATGMLGAGFREESIASAIKLGAQMIGCDAGSTDAGPCFLASGQAQFSAASVKRDLGVLVDYGCRFNLPVLIGSSGTAGGDLNLKELEALLREIAAERSLHFTYATIGAELSGDQLHDLRERQRIRPLNGADPLTANDVDSSLHTVAMMGPEPFQDAIAAGAQVVLAGRSSDSAIFAALPLTAGFDPAACWHMGKVMECGASAVAHRVEPDSMLARVHRDGSFDVLPLRGDYQCTPQSIASHTLYENADPFHLVEPPGVLDTSSSTYEAVDDRTVRVSGSRFRPADEYTVRIEGARLAGYSAVVIGGVRDPLILGQLNPWLSQIESSLAQRAERVGASGRYRLITRVYGRDAVMGSFEPRADQLAHEVGIVWDVLADDQSVSTSLAQSLASVAVHTPIPEWEGLISGVAFPFAPPVIERGPTFEFHMNHVVAPDSPTSLFPIKLHQA